MRASSLFLLVFSLLGGCTLFAVEPPCRSDDNCVGQRRCDVETRRCVGPDAGAVDADAGEV